MYKLVLILLIVAVIGGIASFFIPPIQKTDDYAFPLKGWPLGYYKTIDTTGLCTGEGLTVDNKVIECGEVAHTINYIHLAEDVLLWLIPASAISYFIYTRKRT